LNIYLKMNVIAVEYPGYGVYQGVQTTAQMIKDDSEIVYKFITN
jgi:hypothetical protein